MMKNCSTEVTQASLNKLLAAVPPAYREKTRTVLTDPRFGGRGLRAWLALIEVDDCELPSKLPEELIEVYLRDDDAEPLHDCERCGLAIPVRAGRRCGHEASVDYVYFPACPACGGRTGRYAYWSSCCEVASQAPRRATALAR